MQPMGRPGAGEAGEEAVSSPRPWPLRPVKKESRARARAVIPSIGVRTRGSHSYSREAAARNEPVAQVSGGPRASPPGA